MLEPWEAKARLHGGGEIAFLDVREAGQFGEGHPLFAVPCPYSRLELVVSALVPRLDVPVLLIDSGDGVAEKAARRLEGLGYRDVSVVAGGTPAWEQAGLTLFKGVNVPSKTLGELAEAIWHPRTIDAATLREWHGNGEAFRFFDARPPAEFSKMHVPGAVCLPNGELAHRFAAAVKDPETPVLISCAGRTRGIVGAIGLKLAGVPNPVFALENGTQGWALAGEDLVRDDLAEPYPDPGEADLGENRRRAKSICERFQIPWIEGASSLADIQADQTRTTYLFDVRSAQEFAAGHIPGAVHAPGGQLVQATDQWIGVRHARVVLADDTGLRAALAAFWLKQLGWEVSVLPKTPGLPSLLWGGAGGEGLRQSGKPTSTIQPTPPHETWVGVGAQTHGLIDLRPSQAHRAGHPVGALWAIRPTFGAALSPALLGKGSPPAIVLISDEPGIAELAAIDLREMGYSEIRLLKGGMSAWEAAGLPVEATPDRPSPADAIDFLQFVHDRHDGNLVSSRRYLEWEQGLVAQLDPVERDEFRLEQPAL